MDPASPSPDSAPSPRADEPRTQAPSALGVLRHRHFRIIWLASFGSYLGNWFEFVAIGWLLSQETKSEDWMAFRAAAQLGPTLLLGMLGGLIADSVNRRTLLIVTQLAMMVIALGLAVTVYFDIANRWVLIAFALAQGIAIAFNTPAWQVLTPRLVPKDELTRAITLNGIAFNMARVIGPAVAGGIMRAFQSPTATVATAAAVLSAEAALSRDGSMHGAGALLLVNALTYIGVMVAVLVTPDAPAPPDLRGAWKHPGVILTRSREAFAWVWTHRGPRAVFLAIVVYALLATPVMQLLPLVVSEVFGEREDTFGLLLAVMGIGAVVGGLSMKLVPSWYPMHHFIPASITLGGLSLLLFALAPTLAWGMFIMFFVGVFWMLGFNTTAAAMQHLVDDAMRGRVSAVVNTLALGLMPLGAFLASRVGNTGASLFRRLGSEWVGNGTSTQLGLAFTSLMLFIAGLVMWARRTPEVDGLKPGDHAYDAKPGLWRGITASAHRRRN